MSKMRDALMYSQNRSTILDRANFARSKLSPRAQAANTEGYLKKKGGEEKFKKRRADRLLPDQDPTFKTPTGGFLTVLG